MLKANDSKMRTLAIIACLISSLCPILALKNSSYLKASGDFNNGDYDKVIFPNNRQRTSSVIGVRRKSNCVRNFCEHLDDYPERDVAKALEATSRFDPFFESPEAPPSIEITDRGQFDSDSETSFGETLCEVEIRHIFPKVGLNANNTDRIIINNEQYKQLVVTEMCKENAQCKYSDAFPNGFEASCKQKYMRKRLVSLSDDNNPMIDTFDIPCCCVCTLRRKSIT